MAASAARLSGTGRWAAGAAARAAPLGAAARAAPPGAALSGRRSDCIIMPGLEDARPTTPQQGTGCTRMPRGPARAHLQRRPRHASTGRSSCGPRPTRILPNTRRRRGHGAGARRRARTFPTPGAQEEFLGFRRHHFSLRHRYPDLPSKPVSLRRASGGRGPVGPNDGHHTRSALFPVPFLCSYACHRTFLREMPPSHSRGSPAPPRRSSRPGARPALAAPAPARRAARRGRLARRTQTMEGHADGASFPRLPRPSPARRRGPRAPFARLAHLPIAPAPSPQRSCARPARHSRRRRRRRRRRYRRPTQEPTGLLSREAP